jgi:cytochrome c biogenesis protein CcdA
MKGMSVSLAAAFLAGLVSFVSPCVLPIATISRISSSVCSMMPLPWLMRWMGTP